MKVALIGLDGHPKQIWEGIARLDDVRLVAIACSDAAALADARRSAVASGAAAYESWRELLDREKPDIVGVCDVPGERPEVLIELARRNIHIVTEKPLATTFERLHEVREAVARSGARLTMLLTMRFEAPYLAIRDAIRGGAIGRVVLASVQKSYKLETGRPPWQKVRGQYGGIIPFIGCHALDLVRWTTGEEFTHVAGFTSTTGLSGWNDFEGNASLSLRFAGGGSAAVHLDFHRPKSSRSHGDDRLRVVGTEGVIEACNGDPVQTVGKQVVLARRMGAAEKLALPDPGQLFVDFVQALQSGTESRIPARDAFYITELCLHARHAADTRTVLTL